MEKIYFDYCASAPLHPRVSQVLFETSRNVFANPSSVHETGLKASQLVEDCRQKIADLLNVNMEEVIFTSGATESNNLALFGVCRAMQQKTSKPVHVITSHIEHPSVYNCCQQLEQEGIEVTYIPVDSNGIVDVSDIERAIKDHTVLISIMHVNNETGAIQPVHEIGTVLKNKREDIYFHVDGVQGLGKADLHVDDIDLYTLSGHKIGGPKGIGALIIKKNVDIVPLFYGGNQEFGLRSGTLNVPSIAALAEAIKIAVLKMEERKRQLASLHLLLRSKLSTIRNIVINSPQASKCAPHILNFSFPGIPSAVTISILAKQGIIASSQSACASKGDKISRILMAATHDSDIASSSIRISIHEEVTRPEMEYLISSIVKMSDFTASKGKMLTLL
ncbi:cysteine desulfurase [Paenibacillus melissococcoides]|uniref:Cysteine desulfurase n=1 Tax=Paenibacillus melissococcoides TaxID=2912268 RepID=A0ABM9FY37_9BACL|nr:MULTISPECIES: cysteine desulfurase family protein [Paenibacillus]MEB9893713.1 cysteine desulfurase family protein [Bacillus cereus]CAH8244141.1 cysteine desulfurase [Paenibacillus melissococcoides]CAH8703786.1 cysteine desulfurase [Paenibacillus melissococcoides]CAH8706335.1 cysteine desulfurase [Paenibacillus melissococcoides]GIO82783.1 aminotransferase V [Paenibacillus dendritiformis]